MDNFISKLKKILEWFGHILEKLSSRPPVGGIYVSGLGIQYISFEKEKAQTYFFRFPPGVMKGGRIQNKEEFINVLKQVRETTNVRKKSQILQVIVTLPAEVVFTQSFEVPNVGEEKLEEAANLNLQMISPISQDLAYMSWQLVKERDDHFELFGAFAEKNIIEEFRNVFEDGLFHPIAFEFPALSLSRVIEKSLNLKDKPVLILYVSGDGINLSILRYHTLQFDYFRSWQSIQGDGKQISREMFERVIIDEVQKVINFTLSRFKEMLDQVIVVAPGFEEDIQRILKGRFGNLGIIPFVFQSQDVTPSWYVAYGSALRGEGDFSRDQHINLNYGMSADLFFEQYTLSFSKLWRNILVIVFFFFFILFFVSATFLNGQLKNINSEMDISKLQVDDKEFTAIRARALEFNTLVDAIRREPREGVFFSNFIDYFIKLSSENNISVDRIELSSPPSPIRVAARAPDTGSVVTFKNILLKNERFKDVDLPLFGIRELSDNTASFSLTFSVNSELFK
jgi:hypothetical protein